MVRRPGSAGSGLSVSVVEEMLATAATAPSLHNSQPWQFVVHRDRDVIDVYADLNRKLPLADRHGRAVAIACGAALFNLRLAAASHSRAPVVRLLPEPGLPRLVARVRIGYGRDGGREERSLHDMTWRRHTNRFPFADDPIPAGVWRELAETATREGVTLRRLAGSDLTRTLALTAVADKAIVADPGRRAEIRSWTTTDSHRADGVPIWAFGPRPARVGSPVLRLRDFDLHDIDPARRVLRFESTAQLAVLFTRRDAVRDWVRAGQALQRVLLTATRHGLSASFLYQALERDDLRALLRPRHEHQAAVQMVLRLGYGQPAAPTPRRAPAQIMRILAHADGH